MNKLFNDDMDGHIQFAKELTEGTVKVLFQGDVGGSWYRLLSNKVLQIGLFQYGNVDGRRYLVGYRRADITDEIMNAIKKEAVCKAMEI